MVHSLQLRGSRVDNENGDHQACGLFVSIKCDSKHLAT